MIVGDDGRITWNLHDFSGPNDNPVDLVETALYCPFVSAMDDGDTVYAAGGDDVIVTGQDADTVYGGPGKG